MIYFHTTNLDPPAGRPIIQGPPSQSLYEDDSITITCLMNGGLPVANISLDCPSLVSRDMTNSSFAASMATGNVQRTLNGRKCTCSAAHYAWLDTEGPKTESPIFNIYCKLKTCR